MTQRPEDDALDKIDWTPEESRLLAALTAEERARLAELSSDLDRAFSGCIPMDTDTGDDLPEDPGLPDSDGGTLAMGRRRRKT